VESRFAQPSSGASGVLFTQGCHFGGLALYVKDNRLHYVYNFVGMLEQRVVATEAIPIGENLILSESCEKDGEDPPGVSTGILSLFHGDQKVGERRIRTQPAAFGLSGTDLTVGCAMSNVTDDLPGRRPWSFSGGTIKTVAVDVSGKPYVDLERAAAAMTARELLLARQATPQACELDQLDVGCRWTFGTLLSVVAHLCPFGERFEAAALDGAVVDEQVLAAVIGRDEAIALVVAEPLHSSGGHAVPPQGDRVLRNAGGARSND
jgi:hypothetical protein